MNLVFCLFKFFPYGGLERDFLKIARICADQGHKIDVYTLSWEGDKPDDFNITIVSAKHWTNHGKCEKFVQKLAELFRHKHYDVVVGFNKMPGLDVYYAADPCYVDKILHSKPGLFRLSNRYKHYAKMEKSVFGVESSTQLLMISDIEQNKFIQHYQTPSQRFHLLPPGISLDRKRPDNADEVRRQWRDEFKLNEDDKVILMIGSAFKRKGLDRALLGLASLDEALKNRTHLMMLGQDNPEPFVAMAEKLGIADRLHIFLGRDDVPRFLLGADLFVHPAYSENTGTVILEAMVAGLPVLVSQACGYAFHVERSGAGLVTPEPFLQEDFNQYLLQMLTSDDYFQWVQNALHYSDSEDLYSMPQTAAEIIIAIAEQNATGIKNRH